MTRPSNQGQDELLRLLARMPFLDRMELAALAGASRGGTYQAVARLAEAGLVASFRHGSALLPATRRYHLSRRGVGELARREARPVERLLRDYPLPVRWRRVLLERLDAVASVYRLTAALADLERPLDFRWYRSSPQDAAVTLTGGRVVLVIRQGATAERAAFAKRAWRLAQGPRPGGVLALAPDEVRLRQAQDLLRQAPAPAFLALERHSAAASAGDPVWRPSWSGAAVSLEEAVGQINTGGLLPEEPPLERAALPRDLDPHPVVPGELDGGADGGDVPDCLLPVLLRPAETRALDLLADWPWLRREDLAGLLDVTNQRASQLIAVLDHFGLVAALRRDRRRLVLSDRALTLLARRDRASPAEARKRWSATPAGGAGKGAEAGRVRVAGRRSRQLLRDLEHTAAVHGFIAALSRQARAQGWDLEQLDPPHRASRYFRHYGGPRSLHPDAFGTLRRGRTRRPFFLEWERRAVRPAAMAQRLAPYLRYYSSHRPMDDHGAVPLVLVVFDDPIAVAHFLEVARGEMQRVRVALPLLASRRELVEREGPLGAAWLAPDGAWEPAPLLSAQD